MKKTLECIDCRVSFTYEHIRGRTRQRCDPCRVARKAEMDRAKTLRYREANRDAYIASSRKHHEKRKQRPGFRDARNEYEMHRKYGITKADFDLLLVQQGGVCAICGGDRSGPGQRFHVDHCHDSGKVRGLLCGNCNTAIGLLGDDPERADKAAAYLRR